MSKHTLKSVSHRKIFKVCLVIFQHCLGLKGLTYHWVRYLLFFWSIFFFNFRLFIVLARIQKAVEGTCLYFSQHTLIHTNQSYCYVKSAHLWNIFSKVFSGKVIQNRKSKYCQSHSVIVQNIHFENIGKRLWWSLFLVELRSYREPTNWLKKGSSCFFTWNFFEIFEIVIFCLFDGYLFASYCYNVDKTATLNIWADKLSQSI